VTSRRGTFFILGLTKIGEEIHTSQKMEAIQKIKRLHHIKLAAIFVGLNIMDGLFTWILAGQGGYELNPITRIVLAQNLAWAYWTFKIGRTLVCTALLLFLANIFPRQTGKVFIIVIIVTSGVCLFNLMGLLGVV